MQAAEQLVAELDDETAGAVESTGRMRLALIAQNASLAAAARAKEEAFVATALAAATPDGASPSVRAETEVRCVAAAMQSAVNGWQRGHGTLRECLAEALSMLQRAGR